MWRMRVIQSMIFDHEFAHSMSVPFTRGGYFEMFYKHLLLHSPSSLVLFAHSSFQKRIIACNIVVMAIVIISCRGMVALALT